MIEMTDLTKQSTHMESIDRVDCVHLLTAHGLGRLAITVRGQPLILPINYTMDGDRVVFRTDGGTKLYGAVGNPVAFEIDGFDRLYHEGWSVVVVGTAEEVHDAAERARLETLPLGPWAPGAKAHWLRIRPGAITGRRLVAGPL
jgi:nitroimidazol reductase NimA-like FMN-containing flavoprotein (pyridoxamine 5'-phosphate oxidase superfamily)